MTTPEAWRFIGAMWKKPQFDLEGFATVTFECGNICYGLCKCFNVLFWEGMINAEQRNYMASKLPFTESPYCWPIDRVGAAARAAFCEEQTCQHGA